MVDYEGLEGILKSLQHTEDMIRCFEGNPEYMSHKDIKECMDACLRNFLFESFIGNPKMEDNPNVLAKNSKFLIMNDKNSVSNRKKTYNNLKTLLNAVYPIPEKYDINNKKEFYFYKDRKWVKSIIDEDLNSLGVKVNADKKVHNSFGFISLIINAKPENFINNFKFNESYFIKGTKGFTQVKYGIVPSKITAKRDYKGPIASLIFCEDSRHVINNPHLQFYKCGNNKINLETNFPEATVLFLKQYEQQGIYKK